MKRVLLNYLTGISLLLAGLSDNSFAQFTNFWKYVFNPSGAYDVPDAIISNASGVYIAGHDNVMGNARWRIEKRDLTSGALIAAFGTGGVVTSNPSGSTDYLYAMTAGESGIYVAGYDNVLGTGRWRIEKRDLTTGALVAAFGTGGIVTSTNGGTPYSIAADASGIYIAGVDYIPGNAQWRIEKRDLASGNLIPGFGISGVVTSNPSTSSDWAKAIVVNGSGIYVGGLDYTNGGQWRIEKRDLATGDPIASFGTAGSVVSKTTGGAEHLFAMTADPSGIYVTGYAMQWRIEKRDLTTGALIPAFGTNGAITSITGEPYAIFANISGIYVAGWEMVVSTDYQWRIEKRDLTSGGLICVMTSNPGNSYDFPQAVTGDASGIYVCGVDASFGVLDYQWRIEKYDHCGPLPVYLFRFEGYASGEWNILEWQVTPGLQYDHFDIERADDGKTWKIIGTVPANGGSIPERYSFTDKNPCSGISCYRLKQVEADGTFEYSRVEEVSNDSRSEMYISEVFPNPVAVMLSLHIRLKTGQDDGHSLHLTILDLQGKVLKEESVSSDLLPYGMKWDMKDLTSGMYIVKISGSFGQTFRKFIKE